MHKCIVHCMYKETKRDAYMHDVAIGIRMYSCRLMKLIFPDLIQKHAGWEKRSGYKIKRPG